MTLNDLSTPCRLTLVALGAGLNRRKEIYMHCSDSLSRQQVDRALRRLDAIGLCDRPAHLREDWQLTDQGRALLVASPAPAMAETVTAEPAPVPVIAEPAWRDEAIPSDPIAADLLAAMEIEMALDHVRTKLRAPAIPARAQRVYRELLNTLPPALVEALAPATQLIEAHSALN